MIQIDFASCFLAALSLLILPFDWILGFAISMAFHELCHIIAVILFGGKITRFRITPNGCLLESCKLAQWGQLCSILAGPLGSLSLLVFSRAYPKLAICGFIHGIYNLLPIVPLDGGRLLCLILDKTCPQYTEKIMRTILFVAGFVFSLFMFWKFSVTPGNILLFFIVMIWKCRLLSGNITCNATEFKVQ